MTRSCKLKMIQLLLDSSNRTCEDKAQAVDQRLPAPKRRHRSHTCRQVQLRCQIIFRTQELNKCSKVRTIVTLSKRVPSLNRSWHQLKILTLSITTCTRGVANSSQIRKCWTFDDTIVVIASQIIRWSPSLPQNRVSPPCVLVELRNRLQVELASLL